MTIKIRKFVLESNGGLTMCQKFDETVAKVLKATSSSSRTILDERKLRHIVTQSKVEMNQ